MTHLLSAAQFAHLRAGASWGRRRAAGLRSLSPAQAGSAFEDGTIVPRLINVCWHFFKVGVGAAVAVAVATGAYLYARMDDEIRGHVAAVLAERFPQAAVTVGGARLVEGKGIAVYDVSLAPLAADGEAEPLLTIDEIMLHCDVELATLVQGAPPVERVEVKHPELFLRRGAAGRWNVESLLPLEPCGPRAPTVIVHGGAVTISEEGDGAKPAIEIRDVAATVTPRAGSAAGGPPTLEVAGTAGGPSVRRVTFQAAVDGAAQQIAGEVTIDQLQLNEALHAWIEPALPEAARATRLSGVVDGTVRGTWSAGGAAAAEFTAKLSVSGGRLTDPRLSQPVTDMTAQVTMNGAQLAISEARAKWGSAAVALSLNRSGWSASAPVALSARVDGVPLDESLLEVLATAGNPRGARGLPIANLLREECAKYKPTGVGSGTLQATFDGYRWTPTATLDCRQLAFESDKFAYRLTDGAGTLAFKPAEAERPARIEIKLTAIGGGQRLRIDGEVLDPRPGAAGWVQIQGEGLEIDDRMIAALRDKPREIIASLHPAGKFNLAYWRIDRPQPGVEPQTSLRLDLTDVRINYDHFPYALREIRGAIEARGSHWTFSNLVSGGRRTIHGEGHLRPTPAGGELWLKFTGQEVPLDDNLFYALQPPVQEAWRQLRPTGAVNLTAEVRHLVGQGKPSVGVVIQPGPHSSVRPAFFSYLMDDVSGTIAYRDGEVTLHELKAHDDNGAWMGGSGKGFFAADGGWEFTLSGLWADRMTARPALLAAMPPQLSAIINQLRPSGSFSLHDGELAFRKTASALTPVETGWDVQVECHQTDLNCGVELRNIHGAVRLVGRSDGQRCYSSGELDLESVAYQEVQFTNVKGPLWVDESQCRLGRWATDQMGQPVRRVTANVYGGSVASDAWVRFGALPQYGAETTLTGADLNRMMVERFGGQQAFQGKIDAKMMFTGEGSSLARLAGDGTVHIREANIYELPLLMGLLKVLRTGAPDKTAFNQSDIRFRLQGPHVYLDQIDFLGDVVDLKGYGEVNLNAFGASTLDHDMKLIFRGEFGPREYHLPLVKNLVGQMSQQVMTMYVDGTLSEPHVTREAFPEIGQMLKQIRTDLEAPAAGAATRQAQRDRFGAESSR